MSEARTVAWQTFHSRVEPMLFGCFKADLTQQLQPRLQIPPGRLPGCAMRPMAVWADGRKVGSGFRSSPAGIGDCWRWPA